MQVEGISPEKYLLAEKVYREKPWVKISVCLRIFLCSCVCIFVGIFGEAATIEDMAWKYLALIGGILVIGVGVYRYRTWGKWVITVDSESISNYKGASTVQIKWKDIIALYSFIEIKRGGKPYYSYFIVIPKSDDEVINSEVKENKNGKVAQEYIEWLRSNNKAILFDKRIENYRDLINEICQRVPDIAIDKKIRKLINQ